MDGYALGSTIVTVVLMLVCAFLGGHIKLLKKEMSELISVVTLALRDNEISRDELVDIISEANDVKDAVVSIIGRINWTRPLL